jgi:hypothetical protein
LLFGIAVSQKGSIHETASDCGGGWSPAIDKMRHIVC